MADLRLRGHVRRVRVDVRAERLERRRIARLRVVLDDRALEGALGHDRRAVGERRRGEDEHGGADGCAEQCSGAVVEFGHGLEGSPRPPARPPALTEPLPDPCGSPGVARLGDRSASPPYAAAHERCPARLDRRPHGSPRRAFLPRRSRSRDRAARGVAAGQAAAARGRGRRRQDGGREDARRRARGAPDPPPVLRGHRRRARALRLELRAPDALHPHARGRRRRQRGAQGGLRARLPGAAAAARRDRVRRRRAARAAGRRDRPRRRRVRGVPARAALRLPDHDPGDRHDLGQAAARS